MQPDDFSHSQVVAVMDRLREVAGATRSYCHPLLAIVYHGF
ncbi:hypothetical protein [Scytonema sp. HK-05]|nr:hypothetical protein [Scytonema sp. HK-05]